MIRRWEQERENLLIVDAGDLFYPVLSEPPSEDSKAVMGLKARAIVAAFNHMGADAITLGEGDLLWGMDTLSEIIKDAEFPVVVANLIDKGSGAPVFRPYVVRQIQGLRVGIFGLFPRPRSKAEGRLNGITTLEPVKVATQIVSTLKEEADFVILLSHLGYPEDLELAKKVDGLNVIVGGHTGINLSHPRIIRNTMILQVASKGRYLGRADLRVHDPSQPFVNVATRQVLQRRLELIGARLEALGREGAEDSSESTRKRQTLERQKTEATRLLKSYEGHNELVNQIVPLTDEIPGDEKCETVLEPYLLQISKAEEAKSVKGESAPGPSVANPE
jgi:2',3'-cyclic-nucleotide 2'-phosphodiesterase (5'-nucleotidase family)